MNSTFALDNTGHSVSGEFLVRKPPSSVARITGVTLMALPLLGVIIVLVSTIAGMANRSPHDVAGLSGFAGILVWALAGWVTFLCALAGARLSLRGRSSTRIALFFLAPPLALGLGVLLWDTPMYVPALILVGFYYFMSLLCVIVSPIAISLALKQGKEGPEAITVAGQPTVK